MSLSLLLQVKSRRLFVLLNHFSIYKVDGTNLIRLEASDTYNYDDAYVIIPDSIKLDTYSLSDSGLNDGLKNGNDRSCSR